MACYILNFEKGYCADYYILISHSSSLPKKCCLILKRNLTFLFRNDKQTHILKERCKPLFLLNSAYLKRLFLDLQLKRKEAPTEMKVDEIVSEIVNLGTAKVMLKMFKKV